MDSAVQAGSEAPQHGAGVLHQNQANAHSSGRTEGKRGIRKPSALQVSVTATAMDDPAQSIPKSSKSPTTSRSLTGPSYPSPQSPKHPATAQIESPKSPRERLDEFLKQEDPKTSEDIHYEAKSRNASTSPSKAQSYGLLRNISSPLPDLRPLGHSSPPSPRSTASPPLIGSSLRPEGRQAPRTSSIDSAISSMSTMTQSPHGSEDSSMTLSTEVSNLIRTAGSAESLIQHLLKEKQQTDARCSQLWTMVEKQRKMLFGLKQDLDKAAKDKERYWKRLQEYQNFVPPIPNVKAETAKVAAASRGTSQSPPFSDTSADFPTQRPGVEDSRNVKVSTEPHSPEPSKVEMPPTNENAMASASNSIVSSEKSTRKSAGGAGSNHSHKHTSSSDVGIFNTTTAVHRVPPLQTQDLDRMGHKSKPGFSPQLSPLSRPGASPTSSFTAKRSQPYTAKSFNGPSLTLTESTPPGNNVEAMTPPRKAPPAPLNLGQQRQETGSHIKNVQADDSASEYEEDIEADELLDFERGRKKTREDDDREREILQQKEQEERSRSKKEKGSKSRSASKEKMNEKDVSIKPQTVPMPQMIKALAPEPTPALASSSFLSQPASLASMLDPTTSQKGSEIKEQSVVARPPASPGLPLSPRPSDRPSNAPTPRLPRDTTGSVASPPLSPRPGFVGLPLSPRAPRHPIPFPPSTPGSIVPISLMPQVIPTQTESAPVTGDPPNRTQSPAPSETTLVDADSSQKAERASTVHQPGGIFKGFLSEVYPNLLIPPNALPSIKITVISSRLRPSRQSLVMKGAEEDPVFTLGVSARSDHRELWQVEKAIMSLHHLNQQLRQSSKLDVKLPERSLFSGHAPAKVDARRIGLENYFEAILDTQMDEKAALTLCQYLSTNVSQPGSDDTSAIIHPASPTKSVSNGSTAKEGFLTKRGKNFGGWKARFFVLDEPTLRYYESPGSTLLGTIKLSRARICRQSPPRPSGSGDEGDGQYRHAFLIREPKRKDPNSFTDHVLCAESDKERDAWVSALVHYINSAESDKMVLPGLEKAHSSSSRIVPLHHKTSIKKGSSIKDSPDSEDFDNLQAVPYEDTQPAQAPHVRVTPDVRSEGSPSPNIPGLQPSEKTPSSMSKAISGPQNGTRISDAGAWGNKPLASPLPAQKEYKKRSLFGFHNKDSNHLGAHHPNGSDLSLTQQQYQEQITNVKAVWGAPLADAVEYCPPKGVEEVCLPAVVYRCIKFLEAKDASSEEGIFRMSGSSNLIKNLKNKFNAEGDFDMLASGQWYDVHAVASLLKLYLRDLPSCLLTRELSADFHRVLGMYSMPQVEEVHGMLTVL